MSAHRIPPLVRWLAASAALARYNVRAALRSSPAALVEHVRGTDHAARVFGLGSFKSATGDVLGTVQEVERGARGGWVPETNVAPALPEWLTSPEALAAAAREEAERYARIAALSAELSDARQLARLV